MTGTRYRAPYDRGGERPSGLRCRLFVVQPKQTVVESPPVDHLEKGFAEEQQRQRPVFARRQDARVQRQQQEVDEQDHHVGGAVGEELA